MSTHECPQCGLEHGGIIREQTPAEVRIAEIQKERDIAIARLEYGEAKTLAAIEADTAVVVAELETGSAIAVAEATDAPEAEPEGENQAIIVEGPPVEAEPEPEPTLEPRSEPIPRQERRHTGYWGV